MAAEQEAGEAETGEEAAARRGADLVHRIWDALPEEDAEESRDAYSDSVVVGGSAAAVVVAAAVEKTAVEVVDTVG